MDTKIETFCAWCHPGEPSPTGSHGICKPHADAMLAKFLSTTTREIAGMR